MDLSKLICLLSLFFLISCVGGGGSSSSGPQIFPLVDGECKYLKDAYFDNDLIHITKRLVGNELKCVVEFYVQVGEHGIPLHGNQKKDLSPK